jgi:hypothetical protein
MSLASQSPRAEPTIAVSACLYRSPSLHLSVRPIKQRLPYGNMLKSLSIRFRMERCRVLRCGVHEEKWSMPRVNVEARALF